MSIANVQNICNLIGGEEYKISCTVLLVSILYSVIEKQTSFDFRGTKKKMLITIKSIVNY